MQEANKCAYTGCNNPVINKKWMLCNQHNFMRLHDGKSQQEVYASRSVAKPKKVYVLKNTKPLKQQTKKQGVRAKNLSALKLDIEMEAVQSDMYYCWGCGDSQIGLDKSHILSVGQFKELELERDNINLFCRDCHTIWEGGIIEKQVILLTFEKDIEYIRENSGEYFYRFLHSMQDYLKWETTSRAALTMKKILKKYANLVGTID